MTEYLPIILLVAGVVALTIWLVIRRRSIKSIETRVFSIKDKRTQASGLQIWVEQGAGISPAEIEAIERGLLRCFEKARVRGYDRPLHLDEYIVAIIADSERSPEAQIWSYKLPAGPYAGTEWDLGGYILAAGQMIAGGEPYGNIIAIPDHHGTDLDQLAEIAMYEAEHLIALHCDAELYEATKVHGQGQGHPIF